MVLVIDCFAFALFCFCFLPMLQIYTSVREGWELRPWWSSGCPSF